MTVNGCMRYKGGKEGQIWLEPWNPADTKTEVYEVHTEDCWVLVSCDFVNFVNLYRISEQL